MQNSTDSLDVVVVGAGFAGLYAVQHVRSLGFSVQGFEAGSDVGGTWYWNRYPGARCDVESVDYSYSFSEELQQEFEWTERFAGQPEILRYMQHVATRFDLYRSIQFDARVVGACYDEQSRRWLVELESGAVCSAQFLVLATGPLSVPLVPEIAGMSTFEGSVYQTSQWPKAEVDFTGQRVAVIGTGSSGIQSIPVIAEQCEQLYVFQRTANFSIPAQNSALTREALDQIKANYPERRRLAREDRIGTPYRYRPYGVMEVDEQERTRAFEEAWQRGGTHFTKSFTDIVRNEDSNKYAVDFVHRKIKAIIGDPELADALLPKDHPLGSKRICADTNYYQTYLRDNVTLIDLQRTPLVQIHGTGIRTSTTDYAIDSLILATGFDALTGSFLAIDITGPHHQTLRDTWHAGPRTYLGLAVAGYPNLFLLSGPGSPSVLANMVATAEQQVDWLGNLLTHLRQHHLTSTEADTTAQDQWVDHVNELASHTLFMRANSWYLGANVPGKPRVFMPYVGGLHAYRTLCDDIAASGYRGFRFTE
jgi:cation diffusion facilitator CzcD-associated flavoprotein CzcO